jgi:hypothetical protein
MNQAPTQVFCGSRITIFPNRFPADALESFFLPVQPYQDRATNFFTFLMRQNHLLTEFMPGFAYRVDEAVAAACAAHFPVACLPHEI